MTVDKLFSEMAEDYARRRPLYPDELYTYLAAMAPARDLAWDCATGNGQAARGLIGHFTRVIATDASAAQIERAPGHPGIEYRVEPAEHVSLPESSADLVTVAVAVHWFDLERFYQEVRRVLKPDGVLAVWTYHLPEITAEVDPVIRAYYEEKLRGYWPPGFHYLDERYRTLPFPFSELEPPTFTARAEWDLRQLLGFLGSWSASRTYREANGTDPLEEVLPRLTRAWGHSEQRREVRWPLHLRVGRAG